MDEDCEMVCCFGVSISSPSSAESIDVVVPYEPEVKGLRAGSWVSRWISGISSLSGLRGGEGGKGDCGRDINVVAMP